MPNENHKVYLAKQARQAGLGTSHLTKSDREARTSQRSLLNQRCWITRDTDGDISLSKTYPNAPEEQAEDFKL